MDRLSSAPRYARVTPPDPRRLGRHATIGDLRRLGVGLEYTCSTCGTSRVFDPQTLPFGNLQPVVAAHRRMRCSFCGAQGGTALTRPATAKPLTTIPAR